MALVSHAMVPATQLNVSSSFQGFNLKHSSIYNSGFLPKSGHTRLVQLVSHGEGNHPDLRRFSLPESEIKSVKSTATGAAAVSGELIFGCKIPFHYFVTKGFGQTDQGDGVDPYETGSYDLALEDAGIQDFNIQTYSSVMPREAIHLSFDEAKKYFKHGAVLECIMASMNGNKGDRITAGVGRMKVRRISDGFFIGGYAAEYRGHAQEKDAKKILESDLTGIFRRRFSPDEYDMFDMEYVIQVNEVEKSFGSVLASICFISFIEPLFPK